MIGIHSHGFMGGEEKINMVPTRAPVCTWSSTAQVEADDRKASAMPRPVKTRGVADLEHVAEKVCW